MSIQGSRIFIFGGSGSLGNALIQRYINNNQIINFSRDENKHWSMESKYGTEKLTNVIGDISNYQRVKKALIRHDPHIIIIAAALKHIDRCESAVSECMNTNLIGVQNVLNAIEELRSSALQSTVFVSTDKACSPINAYGMCKALSEKLVVEKSLYNKSKFVVVRYGNVLNSRGSIIPLLHDIGKDNSREQFMLTSENMTRFIMTLEQSCDLIHYAILHGENGDTVIPKLKSMKIKELFNIFSRMYEKPVEVCGLRAGEKMHESLINDTQSRLTIDRDNYYIVKPSYVKKIENNIGEYDYNSNSNFYTEDDLENYLKEINLI
jgi:UDP-N-acetylglucosamine 4,6-dehydratase